MKRFLTIVLLVALSAPAASAAATAKRPAPKRKAARPVVKRTVARPVVPHVVFLKYRVAPADEYFGRLKLSILGIRNTIKDMGLKADADPDRAASVIGGVGLTEDAMHDWERKYPQDSWIPPAIFSLERLYAKVDSDAARGHARAVMAWLVHDYPRSPQAKVGQRELAQNLVGTKREPGPSYTSTAVAGAADGPLPIPLR